MCSSCCNKLINMEKQKVKSGAQKRKECRHEKTIENVNNICQPEPTDATPTVSTSYSEFGSENVKTGVKSKLECIEQE